MLHLVLCTWEAENSCCWWTPDENLNVLLMTDHIRTSRIYPGAAAQLPSEANTSWEVLGPSLITGQWCRKQVWSLPWAMLCSWTCGADRGTGQAQNHIRNGLKASEEQLLSLAHHSTGLLRERDRPSASAAPDMMENKPGDPGSWPCSKLIILTGL